jgi:hypothetical protein
MTRTRILITHSRQFRRSVTNCFVTTHNSVDSRLAFRLKFGNTRSRVAELTSKPLGFELSFRVLTCGSIAFARQTFGLLR